MTLIFHIFILYIAFYSYLRNRRKSVVTTVRKVNQLGSMTENDFETAECFADAFSSVFVQEPLGPLPQCCYSKANVNPVVKLKFLRRMFIMN